MLPVLNHGDQSWGVSLSSFVPDSRPYVGKTQRGIIEQARWSEQRVREFRREIGGKRTAPVSRGAQRRRKEKNRFCVRQRKSLFRTQRSNRKIAAHRWPRYPIVSFRMSRTRRTCGNINLHRCSLLENLSNLSCNWYRFQTHSTMQE